MKKTYDLIFSLGGACATANQIKRRGMRFCSLPLDYCFFSHDGTALKMLAKSFDEDFKNFLLKENLEELVGSERGADHNGKMQYIDKYTQYKWVNHFVNPITVPGAYEEVKDKIDRRIERLDSFLKQSSEVLAIVDVAFDIDIECFNVLNKSLKAKFPNCNFSFYYLRFNAEDDSMKVIDNITIQNVPRPKNLYDFTQTNYCWSFLDDCQLSEKLKPVSLNNTISTIRSNVSNVKKSNLLCRFKLLGYGLILCIIQLPLFYFLFKSSTSTLIKKIRKYGEV